MAAVPAAIAAGSAITPMGWLMAGSSVLGSALRPAGAGPSSANSLFGTNLAFDNSGWNVALGGSKIDSTAAKASDQGTGGMQDPTAQYLRYGLLALAVVVAWKIVKKS